MSEHSHDHHHLVSKRWGKAAEAAFAILGSAELVMAFLLGRLSLTMLGGHDLADAVSLRQQAENSSNIELEIKERHKNRARSSAIIVGSAAVTLAEGSLQLAGVKLFGKEFSSIENTGFLAVASTSVAVNGLMAVMPVINLARRNGHEHHDHEHHNHEHREEIKKDDKQLIRHVLSDVVVSGSVLAGGIATARGVPHIDESVGLASAVYMTKNFFKDAIRAPLNKVRGRSRSNGD